MPVYEEGHTRGELISFYRHAVGRPAAVPVDPIPDIVKPDSTEPAPMRGDGVWLHCDDGPPYLDAVSGTFNLPLGYDHPQVVRCVSEQLGRIAHVSSHFAAQRVAALRQKGQHHLWGLRYPASCLLRLATSLWRSSSHP